MSFAGVGSPGDGAIAPSTGGGGIGVGGAFGIAAVGQLVSSIGSAIASKRNADRSAKIQKQIARQNRFLRSIQATRFLARQRVSTAARGLAGQSATDILLDSAFLEGIDIDRIGFREDLTAANLRAAGRNALASGITEGLGGAAQTAFLGAELGRQLETVRQTETALGAQPTLGSTP